MLAMTAKWTSYYAAFRVFPDRACNCRPRACTTFRTVENSGLPAADNALYKLSRPKPVFPAIWVILLAPAIPPSVATIKMQPLELAEHQDYFLNFILRINTIASLFFQDEPPGAEPFIGMGIGRAPYTLGADSGINGPGKTAVFNQTG